MNKIFSIIAYPLILLFVAGAILVDELFSFFHKFYTKATKKK